MLKSLQHDEALLADIDAARNVPGKRHIWWPGQSGFRLQLNGTRLLFDPYLSDSLSVKYANTNRTHTRISGRVIDPVRLPRIDVMTSSHNHTDHLDADTLRPILVNSPRATLLIPEANRTFVADRLQIDPTHPIRLVADTIVDTDGLEVHPVPAAHNDLETDEQGRHVFMGYVVRWGGYAIYHSGDTLWYDGLPEILAPFQIDVAFLPINGDVPERRVAGNLNPTEAARLGKRIGAKLVIPHHYDLFAFNTANPAACEREGTPHRVVQLGERVTI